MESGNDVNNLSESVKYKTTLISFPLASPSQWQFVSGWVARNEVRSGKESEEGIRGSSPWKWGRELATE